MIFFANLHRRGRFSFVEFARRRSLVEADHCFASIVGGLARRSPKSSTIRRVVVLEQRHRSGELRGSVVAVGEGVTEEHEDRARSESTSVVACRVESIGEQ